MSYSHEYSDRWSALDLKLTKTEIREDARKAVAELNKIGVFLWAVSAQEPPIEEENWQVLADKAYEVADTMEHYLVKHLE